MCVKIYALPQILVKIEHILELFKFKVVGEVLYKHMLSYNIDLNNTYSSCLFVYCSGAIARSLRIELHSLTSCFTLLIMPCLFYFFPSQS